MSTESVIAPLSSGFFRGYDGGRHKSSAGDNSSPVRAPPPVSSSSLRLSGSSSSPLLPALFSAASFEPRSSQQSNLISDAQSRAAAQYTPLPPLEHASFHNLIKEPPTSLPSQRPLRSVRQEPVEPIPTMDLRNLPVDKWEARGAAIRSSI